MPYSAKVKSKAQSRFLESIAHGMKPKKGGPSKKQAKEMTAGEADQKKEMYAMLPERKKK